MMAANTTPSRSSDVQRDQRERFWRLFRWSVAGALVVVIAFYFTLPNIWLSLSFLGLMVVMAGFLSAYYAMLRVER